jgi:crotonobetainyl-CoA:carnitine CoA-transferase CaiB-like acyl-CoA transferase
MNATPSSPPQPLSGVRVLDLTRLLPGGWATMLLADLGAEVIKVEHPAGGDNARAAQPRYAGPARDESVYFCSLNRNKRSVALDLKRDDDRAAFLALVDSADVVIENFRPGVADRLGVGYEALSRRRPGLVYCALTGYGQTGDLAALAGHDLNVAGMSGLLQRDPGEAPRMPNVLMGDFAGATMAAVGILAAIVDRERHGRGAFLDVAMLDALVSWTNVQMTPTFAAAFRDAPQGAIEGWGGNPRYGLYATRDGRWLTVSLLEKKYWDAFCRMHGRDDLVNAAETEADRLTSHGERGDAYRRFLTDLFATRVRDEWIALLQPLGIPVCPVLAPHEVYAAAHGRQRGHFFAMPCPGLEHPIPQVGFPFHMTLSDGTDAFAARRAPPRLGEANAELAGTRADVDV